MTEYWLLKKTLGTWTKVSWWSEEEFGKAQISYQNLVNAKGYAVRLVKVNVVSEHLLDEMLPEPKEEVEVVEAAPVKSGWGSSWGAPEVKKEAWSTAKEEAAHVSLNGHGLAGKVWLGNPTTKEKKRVAPEEVAGMMAAGWIKAGPRTQL